MVYLVQSEARLSGMDMEGTQAYYGASAAMEKLVVDLNALYAGPLEPTVAAIEGLGTSTYYPSLPGVTYSQYSLSVPNTGGIADIEVRYISGGPSHGLMADIIPVTLSVTVQGASGEVAEMTREVEISRIPVFQFGVFSDGDLSYFSNGLIQLRSRVHTNGNLFLAAGSTKELVFYSRVSAAKEVVRAELANGLSPAVEGWTSSVKIPTAPNGCEGAMPACRDLLSSEGSKTGGPASADNPVWTKLSESVYSGMILNEDTGAKALRLPFVNSSTAPIELIRRPPTGEDPTSILSQSRLYNLAQIRVLFSDNVADLPGGTGIQLINVPPYFFFGFYGLTDTAFAEVDGDYSPIFSNGVPLIEGYLLVQSRQADSSYNDVTLEWLNLGIARDNPNAILKFQEIHDRSPLDGLPDSGQSLNDPDDSWPLALYDAREGEVRDLVSNSDCALGGVMNIVELDVHNLGHWLAGDIGTTGTQVESVSQNGYLLYFSDRRGMLPNGGGDMVGYGYEDLINPADAAGAPNGTLDAAEDVNQNGVLDTYGAGNLGDGFGVPNGDPTLRINCVDLARIHRVSGARHALKLVNGILGFLPTPGFTVGSENPVYVQGDYNANAGFGDPHAAAAIIADSVTFLSNNWGNWRSFLYPNDPSLRVATPTWYRVAVAAGKTMSWPNPGWSSSHDDGLDGGTHNFVRYLEDWSGQTLYYRGSLVSLHYSEYGVGTYKCCTSVYSPPSRDYSFDTDFLDPAKRPPGTPRLQDIVAMGFRQLFSSN